MKNFSWPSHLSKVLGSFCVKLKGSKCECPGFLPLRLDIPLFTCYMMGTVHKSTTKKSRQSAFNGKFWQRKVVSAVMT